MKASYLHQHLQQLGTWVDWATTCDRFVAGNSEAEVKGIVVAWQATMDTIKKAVDMGCNLLITHEPIYYAHPDHDERVYGHPRAAEKRKLIEDNGITVYRCHDLWDRMPDIGIVDSWAKHLQLTGELASDEYHSAYPSPAATALELAKYVAEKTKDLNQETVELVGDPEIKVTKVAIGCGAIANYESMLKLDVDAVIGTDDGMNYWNSGSWLIDMKIPLILVNHCVAEEPGIMNLAKYVGKIFPDVKTTYIPQGCAFRIVG